jgi:hypothetical protein
MNVSRLIVSVARSEARIEMAVRDTIGEYHTIRRAKIKSFTFRRKQKWYDEFLRMNVLISCYSKQTYFVWKYFSYTPRKWKISKLQSEYNLKGYLHSLVDIRGFKDRSNGAICSGSMILEMQGFLWTDTSVMTVILYRKADI